MLLKFPSDLFYFLFELSRVLSYNFLIGDCQMTRPHPFLKCIWVSVLFLVLPFSPSHAELYSWEDESGVINYSDNKDAAPPDAKVDVWTKRPDPSSTPEGPAEATELENNRTGPAEPVERKEAVATQGTFVVKLVEELGLAQNSSPEEAADLLTRIRVAPPLGRWELDQPIAPELVGRLRALTVSAAQMDWISIKPEQALLAFDATAALLAVPIPVEERPRSSGDSYTTVVQTPPLVLIAPPPPHMNSSYVWVPVESGFYTSGVWWNGYYVFNDRRPIFFHRHRVIVVPRPFIEDHFIVHVRPRPHFRGRPPIVHSRPPIVSGPPMPFPRPERRLRGGSPRTFQASPSHPTVTTPLAPRIGNQMTPLAPRIGNRAVPQAPRIDPPAPAPGRFRDRRGRMAPQAPSSQPEPSLGIPGGRSLRGRG